MSDRIVLVTGGSRGIGAAIARLCARDGWRVALNYRADARAADAVVADIRRGGGDAHAFQADLGDSTAIPALVDAIEREMGVPLALVNNAGITGGLGRFADLREQVLREVIELNLVATMLCSQQLLRRWTRAGMRGRIVNVSSIAATTGSPHEYVHYAASKAAVDTFTIGLARELAGEGIRVNAVSPGVTRTDIHAAGGDPQRAQRLASRIPLGRAAEPDEIAEAVAWLLSDQASYATGTVMRVAGGL
jgi:NAD(P)-dependent dehydrogenase (short-subunit alcohol dehydrogenase family)